MTGPTEILGPDRIDHHLAHAWNELTAATGGSYFETSTWCLAWWEHLAGRPDTQIAVWRGPDGSLEAVAAASRLQQPILRGSGPTVRVWVNTGSGAGAGDHLGWPAIPERSGDVVDWARTHLGGPLLLSNVTPLRSVGLATRGFDLVEVSSTLAADLGEGADWFPGSRDFRKKLRYYRRQLERLNVELEVLDATQITPGLFEQLLMLHAARSDDMGWGTHFDDARKAFHLELIDHGRSDFGPAMCVARRGDQVVGILYGFRFARSFSYFQTGWSKEFVKQSLGSVLVAHTMEWAAQNGLGRFDFLRGDDEYKRRFGAAPRGDETWMLTRGAAGKTIRIRQVLAGLFKGGES